MASNPRAPSVAARGRSMPWVWRAEGDAEGRIPLARLEVAPPARPAQPTNPFWKAMEDKENVNPNVGTVQRQEMDETDATQ